MKVLCIVMLFSSMLFGQILYEEHFTGGVAQLQWDPWVDPSVMTPVSDPTTPGGDSWIGCVSNSGAPIACMYAGDYELTDYQVEAWIFTTVATAMGSYNGLCVRIDTATGVNAMYQLISDFDNNARLLLRHIAGATPTTIREWTGGEIPGGIPASSSWHKFKLKVVADSIWAYYDDTMLPDCPFIDSRVTKGYFGIYFFNVMVADSTRCDDVIASTPTGISEYGSQTVNTVAVYPNPFRSNTTIRYMTHDAGYTVESLRLTVYDASGRMVRSLGPVSGIVDYGSSVVWDGTDAGGNVVAPGVYFITDGAGVQLEKVVKLR